MEVNTTCPICHTAIKTQHVFADNNQVYLRKTLKNESQTDLNSEEWFPINFQWITVFELNNNFNHQSNKSSK